jgi:hypothetical protein
MTATAKNNPRLRRLTDWLADNQAHLLWMAPVDGVGHVDCYRLPRGHQLMVLRYRPRRGGDIEGFDLFPMTAHDTTSLDETFEAAELHLGLRGAEDHEGVLRTTVAGVLRLLQARGAEVNRDLVLDVLHHVTGWLGKPLWHASFPGLSSGLADRFAPRAPDMRGGYVRIETGTGGAVRDFSFPVASHGFKRDVWKAWQEHSSATGHTDYDSDDEYAIHCRECPYDEYQQPSVTFFHEPNQECDGYAECPRWARRAYVHREHEEVRHYCGECHKLASLDGWRAVPTGQWSILHQHKSGLYGQLDMLDFVRANAEALTQAELDALHQLDPEQSLDFGGGAVPGVTLKRLSR